MDHQLLALVFGIVAGLITHIILRALGYKETIGGSLTACALTVYLLMK